MNLWSCAARTGQMQRPLGDPDTAWHCELLHTGRQVRGLTYRDVVHAQIAADGAHHDVSGVDTDADLHLHCLRAAKLDLGGDWRRLEARIEEPYPPRSPSSRTDDRARHRPDHLQCHSCGYWQGRCLHQGPRLRRLARHRAETNLDRRPHLGGAYPNAETATCGNCSCRLSCWQSTLIIRNREPVAGRTVSGREK
jgi:hypothetical protein